MSEQVGVGLIARQQFFEPVRFGGDGGHEVVAGGRRAAQDDCGVARGLVGRAARISLGFLNLDVSLILGFDDIVEGFDHINGRLRVRADFA